MNKKLPIGLGLTVFATVLSIIAVGIYTTVMYTMIAVYAILAIALVIGVAAVGVARIVGRKSWLNVAPVLNAVLMGSAGAWAAMVMVNQLGYVASGLDPIGTISGFIAFEVVAVVAMVINIIASFIGVERAA